MPEEGPARTNADHCVGEERSYIVERRAPITSAEAENGERREKPGQMSVPAGLPFCCGSQGRFMAPNDAGHLHTLHTSIEKVGLFQFYSIRMVKLTLPDPSGPAGRGHTMMEREGEGCVCVFEREREKEREREGGQRERET